jgi:hypothetical protein
MADARNKTANQKTTPAAGSSHRRASATIRLAGDLHNERGGTMLPYDTLIQLTITKIYAAKDNYEVEFQDDARHIAYGTYEGPDSYSIDHAPTQEDFDAIAKVLETCSTAGK